MAMTASLQDWLGNIELTMMQLRSLHVDRKNISTVRNAVGNLVFVDNDAEEAIAWLDTPTGELNMFYDEEDPTP